MFQNKRINLIISVVCAVFLWMYVTGTVDPSVSRKFTGIPIELINKENLKQDGLIIEKTDPLKMDLVLEGNRTVLKNINKSDIKINADLFNRHRGRNYVSLEIILPKGVKIESKSLEKLMVEIGERREIQKNVQINVRGRLPKNTVLGNMRVNPEKVSIYGAMSNLKRIYTVKAYINAKEISYEEKIFNTKAIAYDRMGQRVHNIQVEPEEIATTVKLAKAKRVKLKVPFKGKIDETMELSKVEVPKTIIIEGDEKLLNHISLIHCREIDINGIKKTTLFDVVPELPHGVRISKLNMNRNLKLKVILKKPESRKFFIRGEDIEIENLNEKFKGEINEDVSLFIFAGRNIIKNLKREDFTVYVDGRGAIYGNNEREILLRIKEGIKITDFTAKPNKVTLKIKEANQ